MVSFDVESLFINVPIDGAVQATRRKLETDPDIENRTSVTPAEIAGLLDFVLRSIYFQYNGWIYEQQEGAATGSPVSAVISNLYMEVFEVQAIESTPYKPKIWKRYVDDTFTIFDRSIVDSFLQHLSYQQPTIRITMETEKDNKIAFLVMSRRLPYHKCLQKTNSHCSVLCIWFSISKTRYCVLAKRLMTKPSVISEEKKPLSSVSVSNGYHSSFVQKLPRLRKQHARRKPATETRQVHRGFTVC